MVDILNNVERLFWVVVVVAGLISLAATVYIVRTAFSPLARVA